MRMALPRPRGHSAYAHRAHPPAAAPRRTGRL